MDHPSEKKRARGNDDDNLTGDDDGRLRCDCCKQLITEDNNIQNNPCNHIVCLLCVVKSNMKRISNPACCQVIDCHQKYTISCQYFKGGIPGEIVENETIAELSDDDIPCILSFLTLKEIMPKRRVCKKWKEAVRKTIVPPSPHSNDSYFSVHSEGKYNAMGVMTRALPNLQQIVICHPGNRHKYNDGEDPYRNLAASTANRTTHDIGIISNFSKLRDLTIYNAPLNGRYPVLFDSFPLLQKLSIKMCTCYRLKWDLDMLAGSPLLKELKCWDNLCLTGDINSLRVLEDTLEKVEIFNSSHVEGNFMDLADFPHLKELDLYETAATGDIRDIGENDFTTLERLVVPKGVYGGHGYKFQRISDGTNVVRSVFLFKKQRPALKMEDWHCILSEDSPDWYDSAEDDEDTPPFDITFVEAGSRIGYRWETDDSNPCEVNWLDPEPDRDSSDYGKYIEALQQIQQVNQYRGFHQPPSEAEYHSIWEGNVEEIDE